MLTPVEIPLTQGLVARVSPEDAELVRGYKWHAARHKHTSYAACRPTGRMVYMHRLILGATGRFQFVDYINHDGLDNTRSNLRLCTPAENNANNRRKRIYDVCRGVEKHGARWVARIVRNGSQLYLGCFETEREAGIAYDAAARAFAHKDAP